jgi:hypothetical protein
MRKTSGLGKAAIGRITKSVGQVISMEELVFAGDPIVFFAT